MNKSLQRAKDSKCDEFYTSYDTVYHELEHYYGVFNGKVVYCNCDNPNSAFVRYFQHRFKDHELSKLISTFYKPNSYGIYSEFTFAKGKLNHKLNGNGDYLSPECQRLLDACDVVVTNPPFSLFREYLTNLLHSGKQFVVLGPINAITYVDVFPLLAARKLFLGYTPLHTNMYFDIPDEYKKTIAQHQGNFAKRGGVIMAYFRNLCWYTNIPRDSTAAPLPLTAKYSEERYTRFTKYDALNVDRLKDIPCDYYGIMGVPMTFIGSWNPAQFAIVECGGKLFITGNKSMCNDGRCRYARMFIKRL